MPTGKDTKHPTPRRSTHRGLTPKIAIVLSQLSTCVKQSSRDLGEFSLFATWLDSQVCRSWA
jgi:hypothetical protein